MIVEVAPLAIISVILGVSEAPEDLRWSGELSTETVSELIHDIESARPRRLIITSTGGDEFAAIRLGRVLHERQIDILVEDYCLSACASYLLPAGNSTIVAEGSLIAFHPLSASTYIVYRDVFPDAPPPENLERLSRYAHAFYDLLGVDTVMFEHAIAAHGVSCVQDDPSQRVGASLLVQGEWWIPSPNYLRRIGIYLDGYWPASPPAARDLLDRVFEVRPSFSAGGSFSQLQSEGERARLSSCG